MAWTAVAVVALVLVLWNCEGSKAEGASGSHAGISNSSEGGAGCGAHRDRGSAVSQEGRCVDASRPGGNRRKRCERNRFEEGQGRKSQKIELLIYVSLLDYIFFKIYHLYPKCF
jgi:hypothetical protein